MLKIKQVDRITNQESLEGESDGEKLYEEFNNEKRL